ncbi:MAG: hypothetical protein RL757_1765 [Bacteroidota bacterium]|jgi:DNA sulfur modification protein DndC
MLDVKYLINEIQDQYLENDNNRPWIVGFSGGKDSTMLLQLVWSAIKGLDGIFKDSRPVYIVCNNTLVENPRILEYTERILNAIQEAAVRDDLPIFVQRTTPKLEETFWLNLIGRGYPAPNSMFRWCTERLKINPTTKFILDKVSDAGEVIILLGTRSAESSARANSIKKHALFGQRLRKHVLPNAFVYAPIKDVETEEVWQYLLQNPPAWANSNRELITLYRNASGGDCPLVIDTTTPSCGQSRFGCWVCTVVNKDKSMEALIDNGEEWMLPLLEIRDYLAENRSNPEHRQKERRNGTITEGVLGPYFPHIRAEILEKLLIAQKEIQETQPDTILITHQELVAIQIIWYRDSIFEPRVSDIYNKIYNSSDMNKKEKQWVKESEILQHVCKETPEDINLIGNLLDLQKSKILMQRKRGLPAELENRIETFIKQQKITEDVN